MAAHFDASAAALKLIADDARDETARAQLGARAGLWESLASALRSSDADTQTQACRAVTNLVHDSDDNRRRAEAILDAVVACASPLATVALRNFASGDDARYVLAAKRAGAARRALGPPVARALLDALLEASDGVDDDARAAVAALAAADDAHLRPLAAAACRWALRAVAAGRGDAVADAVDDGAVAALRRAFVVADAEDEAGDGETDDASDSDSSSDPNPRRLLVPCAKLLWVACAAREPALEAAARDAPLAAAIARRAARAAAPDRAPYFGFLAALSASRDGAAALAGALDAVVAGLSTAEAPRAAAAVRNVALAKPDAVAPHVGALLDAVASGPADAAVACAAALRLGGGVAAAAALAIIVYDADADKFDEKLHPFVRVEASRAACAALATGAVADFVAVRVAAFCLFSDALAGEALAGLAAVAGPRLRRALALPLANTEDGPALSPASRLEAVVAGGGERADAARRILAATDPWANADVARLAAGDPTNPCCGVLLVCWPLGLPRAFAGVDPGAYAMPAAHLHVTVATLRNYTAADLPAGSPERASTTAAWVAVLDRARAHPAWPRGPFRLGFDEPTFRGNCATLRVSDASGAIAAMREALEAAIADRGGRAVVGGEARDRGRPPRGAPTTDPAPHIPDICHSTILRWSAEPQDRAAARAAFARAAAHWEAPVAVDVARVAAVYEEAPFMHGASEFWASDG